MIDARGKVAASTLVFNKDSTPANGVKLEQAKGVLTKHKSELGLVIENRLSHVTKSRLFPRPVSKNKSSQSADTNPGENVVYEQVVDIPVELITQWLNVDTANDHGIADAKRKLERDIGVKLVIKGHTVMETKAVDAFDGIYYRSPVKMELLAYRTSTQGAPLAANHVPFFQFGILAAIPIRNGTFQNNRYVIQFAADGTLTSFEYREPKARLEEALSTGDESLKLLENADIAAIQAETKLLQAKKERLEMEKALLEAQKALTTAQDGI